MRPRILTLTPRTFDAALDRRRFALVRVARGARGLPAPLVDGLVDARPEGLTVGLVDAARPYPARFWLDAFQTRSGPIRRDGSAVPEGYYLYRDGLVVAHHAGGAHADPRQVLRYLLERLVEAPVEDAGGWVHEQAAEPGAGWRHQQRREPPPPPPPPPGPAGVDPYQVLGVAPTCSDDELRKAYKAALKANHPDRVAHLSAALQQFALAQTQAIRAAWETLKSKRGL